MKSNPPGSIPLSKRIAGWIASVSSAERHKIAEFTLVAVGIAALPIAAALATSFLISGKAAFTLDVWTGMLVLAASSWLALPGYLPEHEWSKDSRRRPTVYSYATGSIFMSLSLIIRMIADIHLYSLHAATAASATFIGWNYLSAFVSDHFPGMDFAISGLTVISSIITLLVLNRKLKPNITLQLVWHHQAQFAGVYAAQVRGHFENLGLRVDLVPGGPEANPTKALTTGEADVAIIHAASVIVAQASGDDIVCVAEIMGSSGLVFFCPADKPLRTLGDLKDRRIGYIEDFEEEYLLRAMLASANLDKNDINLVRGESGHSLLDLFAMQELDLCIGHISNEPSRLRARGCKIQVLNR